MDRRRSKTETVSLADGIGLSGLQERIRAELLHSGWVHGVDAGNAQTGRNVLRRADAANGTDRERELFEKFGVHQWCVLIGLDAMRIAMLDEPRTFSREQVRRWIDACNSRDG